MIQFLGLHLNASRATAVALGRDLAVWARAETPMVNVSHDDQRDAAELPPVEWVRAGCYAAQEAYFELPVKARKVWGMALSGPSGWIALDFNYEPVSPLRLVSGERVEQDFGTWLEENPRLVTKVAVVLSPKDYLRFAISGGLATDVTEVDRMGLLQPGQRQWASERVDESSFTRSWLPPVFDSHVSTGRVSEDGMRRTSLPGGTWVVSGAHETDAGLVGVADLRQAVLWVSRTNDGALTFARGVAGLAATPVPAGSRLRRAVLAGLQMIESRVTVTDAQEMETLEAADFLAQREELKSAGHPVERAVMVTPEPALGAAALAAIGSNLVKSWEAYYSAQEQMTESESESESDDRGR